MMVVMRAYVSVRYFRNLLQREQSFSSHGRQLEEMELVVGGLREEKSVLTHELKVAKEKLVSCESLMQRIQLTPGKCPTDTYILFQGMI